MPNAYDTSFAYDGAEPYVLGGVIVLDPHGREPIGVNQPPGYGYDYPFIAPSADVQLLLGDFYLSYEDNLCLYAMPFRVHWLYGFGDDVPAPPGDAPTPTHIKDLVVTDANGVVVFDSTTALNFRQQLWGNRLRIIEWTGSHQVCRCTMYLTWPPNVTPQTYSLSFSPANGVLDPRTCNRLPLRVRSLRVGLAQFGGAVRWRAGYNIDLASNATPRTDGGRLVQQIAMDAVPGAGLGRAPGCTDAVALVRTLNQVQPDASGNFVLQVSDCYRARPSLLVEPVPAPSAIYAATGLNHANAQAAIALDNDCKPCCPCVYYVRTYKGLTSVWNKWVRVAQSAERVRDLFEANIARWLAQRDCRAQNTLNLVLGNNPSCKVFAGASYCNFSKCCLAPVELRFTLRKFTNGVLVPWPSEETPITDATVEGSPIVGEQKYAPMITGPVVRFTLDYANPQDASYAKFKVCVPCKATDTLEVTATAHTPDPAPAPKTQDICILPTPTVPAPILAIWAAAGVPETPTVRAITVRTAPLDPTPARYPCDCV